MNGYNNYQNGYNNLSSNYDYQLYLAQKNEKKALSKNAFTLGMLLLIYELCQFVVSYTYKVVFVSIKSGELILANHDIDSFFRAHRDYITTAFQMAFNATVIGVSFVILMIFAIAMFRINLKSIYRPDKDHVRKIVVCLPAVMLANLAISFVIGLISYILEQNGLIVPEADFSYTDASRLAFFFQIFYAVIMAPIVEETIYRGLVLHLLKPYGKGMAVVISALLFGLMHGNVAQAANGFCFGLVMGTIAVYSNSIIPTIALHMMNNSLAQLFNIAEILESDIINTIYYAAMLLCLVLGLLVVFAYHKKIRLPKDEGCVLSSSARYQSVMLSIPMLIYWCMVAYTFITSFIAANIR